MYTSDKRMLQLVQILKDRGEITFDSDFCKDIEILPQNFTQIKIPGSGRTQHFTPSHIQNAIVKYKVDANWIFGISDVPFRVTQPVTQK